MRHGAAAEPAALRVADQCPPRVQPHVRIAQHLLELRRRHRHVGARPRLRLSRHVRHHVGGQAGCGAASHRPPATTSATSTLAAMASQPRARAGRARNGSRPVARPSTRSARSRRPSKRSSRSVKPGHSGSSRGAPRNSGSVSRGFASIARRYSAQSIIRPSCAVRIQLRILAAQRAQLLAAAEQARQHRGARQIELARRSPRWRSPSAPAAPAARGTPRAA